MKSTLSIKCIDEYFMIALEGPNVIGVFYLDQQTRWHFYKVATINHPTVMSISEVLGELNPDGPLH